MQESSMLRVQAVQDRERGFRRAIVFGAILLLLLLSVTIGKNGKMDTLGQSNGLRNSLERTEVVEGNNHEVAKGVDEESFNLFDRRLFLLHLLCHHHHHHHLLDTANATNGNNGTRYL